MNGHIHLLRQFLGTVVDRERGESTKDPLRGRRRLEDETELKTTIELV